MAGGIEKASGGSKKKIKGIEPEVPPASRCECKLIAKRIHVGDVIGAVIVAEHIRMIVFFCTSRRLRVRPSSFISGKTVFGVFACHTNHIKKPIFGQADLDFARKMFPGLRSIAGHNLIDPLSLSVPDPFYLTFLREPVARVFFPLPGFCPFPATPGRLRRNCAGAACWKTCR